MKAELRIGNRLLYDEDGKWTEQTVKAIGCDTDGFQGYYLDFGWAKVSIEDIYGDGDLMVKGIPLSEEWLVRAGFKSLGGGLFEKAPIDQPNYIIGLSAVPGGTSRHQLYIGRVPYAKYTATHIDFVHEAQNLWKSLTGTELTLKEDKA